jgi:hypothetical protein
MKTYLRPELEDNDQEGRSTRALPNHVCGAPDFPASQQEAWLAEKREA